mmetsp:Transcript_12208/g.28752  ORF Transcript_12208/g.28752 Transcript_12208/m.28752 type:complete len:242 (-) Transcript_12208:385-1110(-)
MRRFHCVSRAASRCCCSTSTRNGNFNMAVWRSSITARCQSSSIASSLLRRAFFSSSCLSLVSMVSTSICWLRNCLTLSVCSLISLSALLRVTARTLWCRAASLASCTLRCSSSCLALSAFQSSLALRFAASVSVQPVTRASLFCFRCSRLDLRGASVGQLPWTPPTEDIILSMSSRVTMVIVADMVSRAQSPRVCGDKLPPDTARRGPLSPPDRCSLVTSFDSFVGKPATTEVKAKYAVRG